MITPAYTSTATERVLPRLALDFTTGALDPRVTVARALNTATRVNNLGYVEGVNADLPRFDYDPVTLAPKGLLIEESRANLLKQSQGFDDTSVWIYGTNNITPNTTVSPAGLSDADTLTATSTGVSFARQQATITASATYTASCFFKKGSVNFGHLSLQSGSDGIRYWFNINTGAVASSAVIGAGYPNVSAKMENYGNGWYRCAVTFTNTTDTAFNFFALFSDADANLNLTSGNTGYLYGAQLEAGAFATSYIPTTTTSLTRNADVVQMTGTNLTSWLDASQGTFVAIGDCYRNTGGNALCALSAGATYGAGNGLLIRANGNTGQIGGNASSTSSPFTRVANTPFTICGTYAGLNATSAVNGANANSIANLDFTGSGTTTFVIGALTTGGSNILNGHAQKIYYYPQQFAQSQVVAYSKFGV